MTTAAGVYLWGTRVGSVACDDGDPYARFEYDQGFLRSGIEISPVSMPLAGGVFRFPALPLQSFQGLPGLLADSLPDKFGNAVIDAWLAARGRAPGSMNAVERLCYTGTRGMGALEFFPELPMTHDPDDMIDLNALAGLAGEVLSRREALSARGEDALAQILRVGTSAGGARAKAVVAWNEETGEFRSGQVDLGPGFGHWIVKFDRVEGNSDKEGEDAPSYTVIEYAYHLMALGAGIEMSECRLQEQGESRHFMTRRFDRAEQGGGKLHMQSLGALAHFDFNAPGAYGYEQAAQVMRMVGLGQRDIERLYRRMAFNVMARNQDDHVKNVSFLMDRVGRWSLAPAYDVTYAYNPGGLWTGSHQMTVNGKRDGFSREDLLACARSMSISPAKAGSIIAEVAKAVGDWVPYAEKAGLDEATAWRIGRAHRLIG